MPAHRIGLIGAGAIGRMHAAIIGDHPGCLLAAIADPGDDARAFAARLGVAWFAGPGAMLDGVSLDGVIIATPNDLHLAGAREVMARGLPMIVEKPVADRFEHGEALADAAEQSGVPVLIGHHRRHNPIIRQAHRLVREGALGEITMANVLYNFTKPAAYFETAWRRSKGNGGPVLINLIHEIDLIRHLCGEITSVQALTSNARRGFEVEDSAAVLLRLAGGGLVTLSVTDSAAAPWSWDLASGEAAHYPPQPVPVQTHFICGTKASLALPTLEFWRYDGTPDWMAPINRTAIAVGQANPYAEQLRHFCAVIEGRETPLVTARDAARSLRATMAVHQAAATGRMVELAG
jgi:predicted dehydrogenase